MVDWRHKLSSRKFWALIGALVTALLTSFGAGAETIERIVGTVAAVGACAVYMLAEAHADAANRGKDGNQND
jgi:CBS-domain-containing membrane protein